MKLHITDRIRKKGILLECIVIICILLGCASEIKKEKAVSEVLWNLSGSITISGAEALFPLMEVWADEFSKNHANLNIEVTNVGSEKGIAALLSGDADLAMVSRNLTPEEESKGLWYLTVSKEGVIPIFNEKNPHLQDILNKGVSRTDLIRLFTARNMLSWGDLLGINNSDPVIVFIRSDPSGTGEVWSDYLGIEQKKLVGIKTPGDLQIIESVFNEPLSISFCNAHSAYSLIGDTIQQGIKVLPIDFNNNGRIDSKEQFYNNLCEVQRAAYLGKYPSHLCRELYVVSIGRPSNPAIIQFLKWIYKDGQKIAAKEGYAVLRNCQTSELINLLDEMELE